MDRHQIRSLIFIVLFVGLIVAIFVLPQSISLWKQRSMNKIIVPSGTTFPVTVQDTCNRKIKIEHRPTRIVSLAPCVTEILYALSANDRLIAVTNYCKYPEEAQKLPKIGGYLDPNVEKVTALNPDLIIGMRGSKRDALDRLYALGMPIVVIDPTKLDEVQQAIKLIGRVTGTNEKATELVKQFSLRRKMIENKLSGIATTARPKTLFLFSLEDQGGVFTVGPGSHIAELINASGGANIAASTTTPWPQLSMETVAAADPQVILVSQSHGIKTTLTTEKALVKLRAKTNWRAISAVKNGRVYIMDDVVNVPGPRLLDVLEQMAAFLHPELSPKNEAK